MNPEIKAKWVAALRSGEYKQAKERLKSNEGFCCLGVLCDVVDPNGWDENNKYNGKGYLIPNDIAFALNLTGTGKLMYMNDDEDKSFAEIADYIEKNL